MLSLPYTSLDSLGGLLGFLAAIYMLVWYISLWWILDRRDMTSTNRFMWIFIVAMVPVLGLLLYWTSKASSREYCSTDRALTERPSSTSGPEA